MQIMNKPDMVLLIDDDNIINFINSKTIKRSSFAENIIAFDNANDALNFMHENCHKKYEPGFSVVVFLDLNMPVMDGWEFLEEVQKMEAYSPEICRIYILSSSIDPMDLEKSKEYEIVLDFISKPLTKEHLEDIAKTYS